MGHLLVQMLLYMLPYVVMNELTIQYKAKQIETTGYWLPFEMIMKSSRGICY